MNPANTHDLGSGRLKSSAEVEKLSLPASLEAKVPPEARGLARDQVKLMVSHRSNNRIVHTRFDQLVTFLDSGDLLVINTSGTLNAALRATDRQGQELELHLSTHHTSDSWVVELRRPTEKGTVPYLDGEPREIYQLPNGGTVRLVARYHANSSRLWVAELSVPLPIGEYLREYGFPIRYGYVAQAWDSGYYQTVYATEKGSAEMPSAGRPFTPELITQLVAHGVRIVPLILHTGVASLETGEPPYEEFYRVSQDTADAVNTARAAQRRVVAVGTTVVRALETVTDMEGVTWAGEGWTDVVVTAQRGIRSVNSLLTGLHEPRSTHLAMLQALAGREHLLLTYASAVDHGYLWHEFGDVHLILP